MAEYVQTNIRVDKAKKELAKKRGLVLTDIFDNALDLALRIETKESTQLLNEKEVLEHELKTLEENKNLYLENYNKDKSMIEYKLQTIDKALNDVIIKEENESQKESFDNIVREVYNGRNINDNDIVDLLNVHSDKYNVPFDDLKESILDEVEYQKFH